MIVKAQYCGNHVAGLYVGSNNARRYFSKRNRQVELELGHLRILCGLNPPFWQNKPAIEDPRLCVWLETKHPQQAPSQTEIPLALVPSGKNSFRLAEIARKANAQLKKQRVSSERVASEPGPDWN